MNGPNALVNVTFCRILVDQWVVDGLGLACIAPGSRSTPLAIALAEREDLRVEIFHDERSASFAALGHGLLTGSAAVVLCTSGTAAAHFHAAVIEADLSAVPLIVCTADRPPELWGRGAPQTIDQTDLYGDVVRDFVQPGPPEDVDRRNWRDIAQRAWGSAHQLHPGPVHLNLSFREPLASDVDADPGHVPAALEPWPHPTGTPDEDVARELAELVAGRRGIIVAGRGQTPAASVLRLAERLGWPVIADHRSGCRSDRPLVVHRFDALLRHPPFAEQHQPEVILRLGEIVASKAVSQWIARGHATVAAGRPHTRHIDPENRAAYQFDEAGAVDSLLRSLDEDAATDAEWSRSWRRADDLAESVIATGLAASSETNEIAVARAVVRDVPPRGCLVVASSMPVRDVEWFGQPRDDITVLANRGANGIDGMVATAIGAAATGTPTVCLVGDIAFLHDTSSLTALARRELDLTVVVVDNDGGGIFSFLPQHTQLAPERYEQLFGTPHGTDLAALARAHGLAVEQWPSALRPSGVRVVLATTDRAANLRLHDELNAAVATALGPSPIAP